MGREHLAGAEHAEPVRAAAVGRADLGVLPVGGFRLAVGTYMPDNETQLTLAESWNGSQWTQQAPPARAT